MNESDPVQKTSVASTSGIESDGMMDSIPRVARSDLDSFSDHRIVETHIPTKGSPTLVQPRRRWRQAHWPKITEALKERAPHIISPAPMLSTPSAAAFEAQVSVLEEEMRQAATPHVPKARPSSRRKHLWNKDAEEAHVALKQAKRRGERYKRKYGYLPTGLREDAEVARKNLRAIIRTRKREAWREFIVEKSGCTKDLWQTFKRITKPSKTQNIAFITTGEGEVVEDPERICERLFEKILPINPSRRTP